MTHPDVSASVILLSRRMYVFSHLSSIGASETCSSLCCLHKLWIYASLSPASSPPKFSYIWQDSSFGDGVDRRSRTGFISMISGGIVSWTRKLQKSVDLSTYKAEYMAFSASSQEFMFLRQLLSYLWVSHYWSNHHLRGQ
jgi:hypothetical protein